MAKKIIIFFFEHFLTVLYIATSSNNYNLYDKKKKIQLILFTVYSVWERIGIDK